MDELSFLHFNDVVSGKLHSGSHYVISGPVPVSHHPVNCPRETIARRKSKDVPEADRPIIIFSGDAFSPSLESAVMKSDIEPVLYHLLVDVACYRNHGRT